MYAIYGWDSPKRLPTRRPLKQVLPEAVPACSNPHQYHANECHSRLRQCANWPFDRQWHAEDVGTTLEAL